MNEKIKLLRMALPEKMIGRLNECGYFEAPAAKSHHGNYKGGLLDHSVEVAKQLNHMTERMGLVWERKESPIVVGLLHDLCKMEDYIWKDTQEGFLIETNKKKTLPGHGEASVIWAQQIAQGTGFSLTAEEIYCIRYHMGAYEKEAWEQLSNIIRMYPNALWTYMADMIASQVKGV